MCKIETSDGVIPLIFAAWSREVGLNLDNFCLVSDLSPEILL